MTAAAGRPRRVSCGGKQSEGFVLGAWVVVIAGGRDIQRRGHQRRAQRRKAGDPEKESGDGSNFCLETPGRIPGPRGAGILPAACISQVIRAGDESARADWKSQAADHCHILLF